MEDNVHAQSDCFSSVPLSALRPSVDPSYSDITKAMSGMREPVLAEAEKAWIYVLEDPRTGQVRYVGQTSNPARRYHSHCMPSHAASNSMRLHDWVARLRNRGLKPIMRLIEETTCANVAYREYYWIRFYVKAGNILMNSNYARGLKGKRRKRPRDLGAGTRDFFKGHAINKKKPRAA